MGCWGQSPIFQNIFEKGAPDRCRRRSKMMERTHDLMTSLDALMPLIVSRALSIVGAIVILVLGLWLSGRADAYVVRMLARAPHVIRC